MFLNTFDIGYDIVFVTNLMELIFSANSLSRLVDCIVLYPNRFDLVFFAINKKMGVSRIMYVVIRL